MMSAGLRRGLGFYAAVICVLSVLPVLVIVIESLTASDYVVFPPPGFSLKWYQEAARREEFQQAALLSLGVALAVSLLSSLLGTCVALALVRHHFFGRTALQALFMAPLSLPGIVFGLALLQFLAAYALPRDMIAITVGHVIITLPFAVRFITVALAGIPPVLERAAQSLGADGWSIFWRVTLPMIRPGFVASLVFAFILSFDDVAVALFLTTPNSTTLPVRIYVYIDQNYDPLITAVSAVVVLAAFFVLAVMERTMGIGKLFGLR
ncbi:MAG: ABC transporter permease [Acetobacteraceae bacterium]|nr:ABC transporter permease [Acetobacteraceae bacterium]MSP29392.1 ABC transporter permease [Acetobacteraceae bacterium]